MIIFIVGIFLILYSAYSKKYSIWVGFLFVLLIMGFQEGVPGDYEAYKYNFESHGSVVGSMYSSVKEGEYSFLWILFSLSPFMSFHSYVLLSSAIQCLIMVFFIKTVADKRYYFFGVLLVFFTLQIMLLDMKAMRQGYATELMLLSYLLLYKRRYLFSLLTIIIAYGFHNSMILTIPFYAVLWVIMFLRRKQTNGDRVTKVENNNGFLPAVIVSLGLFVFYFLKFYVFDLYISPYLQGLEYFEYGGFLDEYVVNKRIAWWILLYYAISLFFLTVYFVNEHNFFKKYITLISIVGVFLYIGVDGYGNLMRMYMYFVIFTIAIFPNVAAMIRDSFGKKKALGYVIFNMLFLIWISVRPMLSMDFDNGTGYGTYTFSFLNW